MAATTTIQLTTDTRERLKSKGVKGETYDQIINRLLEAEEKLGFYEETYDMLHKEDDWTDLDELE